LLVAWPGPIEQVQLLPGPERQLSQEIPALPAASEKSQALIGPFTSSESIPANVGAYLTGDGNVVLLDATLIYRINDPIAYALQQSHVAPALARLFRSTGVQVTAGRNLNDFLVVQASGSQSGDNEAVVALRSEARESLLRAMNARLSRLAESGASLGVTLERIDMTAWLPPEAKTAFDAVLVATQAADRGVAVARTDAERRRQEADRERDRLLSGSHATALERVSNAQVATARILALAQQETPATRNSVLLREYRAGVGNIMNRVGSATLVDPGSGARLVLPGNNR
jgi:regulator of protease activity HflC (stomatin/prohibitin superfamily)